MIIHLGKSDFFKVILKNIILYIPHYIVKALNIVLTLKVEIFEENRIIKLEGLKTVTHALFNSPLIHNAES